VTIQNKVPAEAAKELYRTIEFSLLRAASSVLQGRAKRAPESQVRSPHKFSDSDSTFSKAGPHVEAMLVRKAYKFLIYPDATQEGLFQRPIYDLCLDQKNLERERSSPRKLRMPALTMTER
jgi:hypothetical protein